ncbi:MAG: hypothetical protein ABR556_01835 [Pyrinomonadaceae bacterium]
MRRRTLHRANKLWERSGQKTWLQRIAAHEHMLVNDFVPRTALLAGLVATL